MSRAGWPGGKLSAPKLFQSVSTSGPSATVKPMPTKTSSSSWMACVTRCTCPAGGRRRLQGGFEPLAHVAPLVGLERPQPLAELGERGAAADHRALDGPQLVDGRGCGDADAGGILDAPDLGREIVASGVAVACRARGVVGAHGVVAHRLPLMLRCTLPPPAASRPVHCAGHGAVRGSAVGAATRSTGSCPPCRR